jgi:hypothetical protein
MTRINKVFDYNFNESRKFVNKYSGMERKDFFVLFSKELKKTLPDIQIKLISDMMAKHYQNPQIDTSTKEFKENLLKSYLYLSYKQMRDILNEPSVNVLV